MASSNSTGAWPAATATATTIACGCSSSPAGYGPDPTLRCEANKRLELDEYQCNVTEGQPVKLANICRD